MWCAKALLPVVVSASGLPLTAQHGAGALPGRLSGGEGSVHGPGVHGLCFSLCSLLARLLALVLACLLTGLLACMLACLLACLPTGFPACLLACVLLPAGWLLLLSCSLIAGADGWRPVECSSRPGPAGDTALEQQVPYSLRCLLALELKSLLSCV